jgi:Pyrimidine dimer DNA glycosylase
MQTFLPYRDFERSAAVLDPARLGKQRVETLQVLRAIVLPDYGWRHHPAVTMWRGRVPALVRYGLACVDAWTAAGRADTTRQQITEFAPEVVGRSQHELADAGLLPRWIGDGAVHLSHRSALVRKDPGYYRRVFGDVPADLPYVWPGADPGNGPPEAPAGEPVWVVRQAAGRPRPRTGVGLAAFPPGGARSPKWRRQVEAFTGAMSVGDLVAVPLDGGARLRLGRVLGDAVVRSGQYRRPVEWTGQIERSDVERPATLQDPRSLFRVHLRPPPSR